MLLLKLETLFRLGCLHYVAFKTFQMIDRVIWNQRFFNFIYSIERHQCASVTYHLSNDDCKGSDLDNKCKGTGEQLARIKDLASLENAEQAVTDHETKYWTGLR